MSPIALTKEDTLIQLDLMFPEDAGFKTFKTENNMIQLEAGTVLEREYKGNTVKVKVLKNGNFSFNGKEYESRGDLMKAIGKGKTMQFTTFFGLNKEENGEDKPKRSKSADTVNNSTDVINISFNEDALNNLIDSRIRNFFNK